MLGDAKTMMPAGTYWVGDPCYAVPEDRWMEWLNAADYESDDVMLRADLDGRPVLGLATAYGDGSYRGSDGFGYGVDAGLIGAVPVDVAGDPSKYGERQAEVSNLVTFAEDFVCSVSDGVIRIGHITIRTGDDQEEW